MPVIILSLTGVKTAVCSTKRDRARGLRFDNIISARNDYELQCSENLAS